MEPVNTRSQPVRSVTPWVLALLTLVVAACAAFWGFAGASRSTAMWAPSADGISPPRADHDTVQSVVGIFPVLILVLSLLTIVSWVRERRRLARRRLLLRHLNAATGVAAGVYIDVDLLEVGSPLGSDTRRDAFDALALEARQLLDQGEELRALVLSPGWREARAGDPYLRGEIAGLATRAADLERKASAAALTLPPGADPVTASDAGEQPAASVRGAITDPFGAGWAGTVAAVNDEFARAAWLLTGGRSAAAGTQAEASSLAEARLKRAGVDFTTRVEGAGLRGNPDARVQSEEVLGARRLVTVAALEAISDLLTVRLAGLERHARVPHARATARSLSQEQLDSIAAPYRVLAGPVVTTDAYASVAAPVLAQERALVRPDAAESGWEKTWDTAFSSRGVFPLMVRGLGVRTTLFLCGVAFSFLLMVSDLGASMVIAVVPAMTTQQALPWLGLAAALALSLVPWAIAALVLALGGGGALSQRRRRNASLSQLTQARTRLANIVARWDETLLALGASHRDSAESVAFTRRRERLESSLSQCLRAARDLDAAPRAEQADDAFGVEVGHLARQVDKLAGWQEQELDPRG